MLRRPRGRKTVTLMSRAAESGWQTDSRADHRKAGRQEAWGGRPQREQTAGMLNYHTSVHDMSTPLRSAQRLNPVQSRVRLPYQWFPLRLSVVRMVPLKSKLGLEGDNNLPVGWWSLCFYWIRDQSVQWGKPGRIFLFKAQCNEFLLLIHPLLNPMLLNVLSFWFHMAHIQLTMLPVTEGAAPILCPFLAS